MKVEVARLFLDGYSLIAERSSNQLKEQGVEVARLFLDGNSRTAELSSDARLREVDSHTIEDTQLAKGVPQSMLTAVALTRRLCTVVVDVG